MTTNTYTPDVFDHAYRAATWLIDRHEPASAHVLPGLPELHRHPGVD